MSITSVPSRGSPLAIDGLISGLATRGVVNKLLAVDGAPAQALKRNGQRLQLRDQAYQELRTRALALRSTAQTLRLADATNAKTATSASPGVVTATAAPNATVGSFQVSVLRLATATSLSSGGTAAPLAIGQAATATASLNTAGLGNRVTAGTFTINGKLITIDPAVDSLSSTINKINASSAGVTASLVADAYGRSNVLQIKSNTAGAPIQLGNAADTSNFVASTGLVANATDTVASGMLGVVQANTPLSAARPGLVASFAASGSFTINGATLSYTGGDTLQTVLGRINASAAGVTAAYDSRTDRLTLTSQTTGASSIALKDVTGNFLRGVGLVDATNTSVGQAAGQSAAYQINAGPTRYSNTNTVAEALPGVNLTLLAAQPTGTPPIGINVGIDTAAVTKKVQAFVSAFNDLADAVNRATRYDPSTKKGSTLTGDTSVLNFAATTRTLVSSAAAAPTGAFRALADIGVSTGPIGSKPGTSSHLVLDADKLARALQANPASVQAVVSQIATSLDTHLGGALASTGLFSTQRASAQARTGLLDNQTTRLEDLLAARQTGYQRRFAAMETALARLSGPLAYAAQLATMSARPR